MVYDTHTHTHTHSLSLSLSLSPRPLLPPQAADDEKEKAHQHRERLQASYMEQLLSAAAQREKVATLRKTATLTGANTGDTGTLVAGGGGSVVGGSGDQTMTTLDNEQRRFIYQVAHLKGQATQSDLDKLDVKAFLRQQIGQDALPARMVISKWGLQGHLTKLGSFMKTWKRRWFVLDLRRGTLAYFPDENSASELGSIVLADVCDVVVPQSREAKETNTFLVVTGKRTFHLRADSVPTMLCWYHLVAAATEPTDVPV